MIAANVAAAEELERLRQPCMYRVHDPPTRKLAALRTFLASLGCPLPGQGPGASARFRRILKPVAGTALRPW